MFLLAAILEYITSCDLFNQSLPDFFEEWTGTARIAAYDFDCPTIDGFLNLSSASDQTIHLSLINPQNYNLNVGVTFPSGIESSDGSKAAPQSDVDWTTRQYSASGVSLTLSKAFLAQYDGSGKDISPTISLTEPRSERNFGGFGIPMRANSAPPQVTNATIVGERNGANETYVLCFTMPDLHEKKNGDIVSLRVSGNGFDKSYTVTPTGDSNDNGLSSEAEVASSYDKNWRTFGGAYTADTDRFVGIKTGILTRAPANPMFTVTLTDSYGLSSSVSVSATVPDFTTKLSSGSTELAASDGNTSFTLGTTDAQQRLTVSLLEGGTVVSDVSSWNVSVSTSTSTGAPITPTSSGGSCSFNFPELGTGKYTLSVSATVNGVVVGPHEYTVYKISVSSGSQTVSEPIEIRGNVTIAPAAGQTVNITTGTADTPAFRITDGSKLTLGGGAGSVVIDGGETNGATNGKESLIRVEGGTLTINDNVTIQNNRLVGGIDFISGGALYIGGGGVVNMTGGTINGCDGGDFGGGVAIWGGTFNISGGKIENCSSYSNGRRGGAVGVWANGAFTMSGNATICNNSNRMGGGVCVSGGGTFTMNGGTIQDNTAQGNQQGFGGGGVWVNGGTFILNSGTITNNNATNGRSTPGGGIAVLGGGSTFRYVSATISGNSAGRGPDVFVESGVRYANSASDETRPLAADITTVDGLRTPQY